MPTRSPTSGIWLSKLDDEGPARRLRSSCSLNAINHPQLSVVRPSKSSENLHRVTIAPLPTTITAAAGGVAPRESQSPVKKASIFSLRRSRKTEKKTTTSSKFNGHCMATAESTARAPPPPAPSASANPLLAASWHPSQLSKGGLLSFFKPSRSRSNHAEKEMSVVVSRTVSGVDRPNFHASVTPSASVGDFTHLRRRRPRSAHCDPNTILFPQQTFSIQSADQIYRRLEKLGEGSYATVYKCEDRLNGTIVALKEIKLQSQEGLPFTAIREASLLRALRHANIVCLHDIFHHPSSLTFVFEYMQMDLSKCLEQHPNGLDPFQVKLFLFQLLRGLSFCHEKKILHRDLKPQNLLLNENGELKLADFGLARAKSVPSRTYSHEVVTLWYRPPDVLLGSTNYSTGLDMWGVGCILAEMCMGAAIFPGSKDVIDQLDKIFAIRGMPDPSKWPEVVGLPHYIPNLFPEYRPVAWRDVSPQLVKLNAGLDLLTQLLQLNPHARISAQGAMCHAYFAALPPMCHVLHPAASIFSVPELEPLTSPNALYITL